MMFLTLPNCPGGPQSVSSRTSLVLVDGANAGGTPGRECPCEDQERRPLAGTMKPSSRTVSDDYIRSPCVGGGGALSPSVVARMLLPVAPALPSCCRWPHWHMWGIVSAFL